MLSNLCNSLLSNQQIHANSNIKIFLTICRKRKVNFIENEYGSKIILRGLITRKELIAIFFKILAKSVN